MIKVNKLKGQVVWVNPDLIAFLEKGRGGPDVVLTLVDGRHLIVIDPPEEVAERIRAHRAQVLAAAFRLEAVEPVDGDGFELHAVPDPED